jgi:hypothetical protein
MLKWLRERFGRKKLSDAVLGTHLHDQLRREREWSPGCNDGLQA